MMIIFIVEMILFWLIEDYEKIGLSAVLVWEMVIWLEIRAKR